MKKIIKLIVILLCCRSAAFPQFPVKNDIVINEILFNPARDGYDYVEGYNRSDLTIDLQHVFIAKRNSTAEIADIEPLARTPSNISPGSFFVVTGNEKWLRQYYHVPEEAIVCQVSSMPSFPDDKGIVLFLNEQDSIIDELSYSEQWHFPLITDVSGVSLERIDHELPTQDKNNWTSASSSSGYGTPGSLNSEYKIGSQMPGAAEVSVFPLLFSPDNDGVNDIEEIKFKIKEPGWVANTIVYDMSGRKVRYLLKNESPGLSGQYKWDGLDERLQPLPQGIYIIVTELYNLKGKTRKFKQAVTLARK